jgi:hypothetical protein
VQWVVTVVAVVALLSAYVTWLAARLDRIAGRCEAGALALLVAQQRLDSLKGASAEEIEQAELRVELARRVHHDALEDDRRLRRRIPVRILGLGRRHVISPYALLDESSP